MTRKRNLVVNKKTKFKIWCSKCGVKLEQSFNKCINCGFKKESKKHSTPFLFGVEEKGETELLEDCFED